MPGPRHRECRDRFPGAPQRPPCRRLQRHDTQADGGQLSFPDHDEARSTRAVQRRIRGCQRQDFAAHDRLTVRIRRDETTVGADQSRDHAAAPV
jgi:hypothetical protein